MKSGDATEAPEFKLESPSWYFSDTLTLALLNAALAGDMVTAQQLVAAGANPNDEGPLDKPNRIGLLHYAIAADNLQAVRILVAVGADPELSVRGFGRALLFPIHLGKTDIFALLLDLRPPSVLDKDTLDYIVFRSVDLGRRDCLELMLSRGVPIDYQDEAGYTPLMRAMDIQDYALAEWLLLHGAAAVREPTVSGATPANVAQFHLGKYRPGSPTHQRVKEIVTMMEARGVVFPVKTPKEIREQRE